MYVTGNKEVPGKSNIVESKARFTTYSRANAVGNWGKGGRKLPAIALDL